MGIKLALWLSAFLLAITYVLSTQMSHASPFLTFTFQELSNVIRNFLIQCVLTFEIFLWTTFLRIQNSIGIPPPKVRVHLGVCGFIPWHSRECKCDSWVVVSTYTFPCFCFGREPKVKVVTLMMPLFFVGGATRSFTTKAWCWLGLSCQPNFLLS